MTLRPSAVASIFDVPLCGAGPGLYLDFATLSFQVPEKLSAANATVAKARTASRPMQVNARVLVMRCPLVSVGLFGAAACYALEQARASRFGKWMYRMSL